MEKICSKCKRLLLTSEFHKQVSKKGGLRSHCKSCRATEAKTDKAKAQRRQGYIRHVEDRRAKSAAWAKANPEKMAEYKANWVKNNTEKRRATVKKWDRANPERVREKGRRWRQEHPEKARAIARRRRARKAAVNENFTAEMDKFVKEFQDYTCAVCSAKLEKPHIDHWRPLSKNFALDMDNAVVMCKSCNSSKHDKLPREIYSPLFIQDVEFMLYDQEDAWIAAEVI